MLEVSLPLSHPTVSFPPPHIQVDPMLQKSAASFDECSTVGIFLSTLHIHSYCSELLFESKVTPLSSSEMMLESPSSAPVKVADINCKCT